METAKVWNLAAALSMLAVIVAFAYAVAQMVVSSHRFELGFTAYLECLRKYQMAKDKLPPDVKAPSGSEVCAKYK